MSRRVYMDHSATTPVRCEVLEAMMPYFDRVFGNASSVHSFGQEGRKAVEGAREKVAGLIGAQPEEVIFTSGGTESDNLAIVGVANACRKKGAHLVTCAIEHHAVLSTCEALEKLDFELTVLDVDEHGLVDPEELRGALRPDTTLVSIMLANNEVGVIEPVAELAAVAHEAGALLHTDAVQAAGKIPVNVEELGVDLLTMSAHKFHGPKGVGALYRRKGTRLRPLMQGGHHERNMRPGTENVPGIVGMATALELACIEMPQEARRLAALRDRLQSGIQERIDDVRVNGHPTRRLPHLLNLSVIGVEGESMLLAMDAHGIAAATGSACTSGSLEPSHVLMAMGVPPEVAHGSLRFSLGRMNTEQDVDHVLEVLPGVVERLREMSPVYNKAQG